MREEPGGPSPAKPSLPLGAELSEFIRRQTYGMGLLSRLLVSELLVFAIVLSGAVLLVNAFSHSLRNNIRYERLLLGKALAEDLDAALRHSLNEFGHITTVYRRSLRDGDPENVRMTLDVLATQPVFGRGILLLDADHKVVAADRRHLELERLDLRRYWPDLWNESPVNAQMVTTAFRLDSQSQPLVAVAAPLAGQGTEGYVVGFMDTTVSYPAQIVARAVRLGGSGHAEILRQDGLALFSTEPKNILRTSDHFGSFRPLLARADNVVSEFPEDQGGEPHLMAFVPLRTVPWALAVGTRVSDAYAPIHDIRLGAFVFLGSLIGMAVLTTVFVGRRIVRPVKELSAAARSVAGGERTMAIHSGWGGEMGDLANSLETMRLRLQAWGSELEKEVKERTSQLEERNRELSALYDTLRRKEEQLRTLLAKVLGAQEDERKRVSRELHDGIGQAISALSMGLERLERARPDQWPELKAQVNGLRELATDTLLDLRRLTIALRPAALDDLGLVPAIRRYADLHLGASGVGFQVKEEGLDERLDPALETVIYRVVQEAINNAARHSGASRVVISLVSQEGKFTATVSDNGRGFDPMSVVSAHGVGLQGMEERATLAGGRLTVSSQPGQGTTVRLEIPLPERVGAARDA